MLSKYSNTVTTLRNPKGCVSLNVLLIILYQNGDRALNSFTGT